MITEHYCFLSKTLFYLPNIVNRHNLAVINSIYEIRKETIEASKGAANWFEGTGGSRQNSASGGRQSNANISQLSEKRWRGFFNFCK